MNTGADEKSKYLDESGIRLAPDPLAAGEVNQLPAVRQDLVIVPTLAVPKGENVDERNTAPDYQPEAKDVNKKWKRGVRTRSFVAGLVMFLASAVVLLPFLLAYFSVAADSLPLKYVFERFDVLGHIVEAFRATAELGWKGAEVNAIWQATVPEILLAAGIIAVTVNLIKSVVGMCGSLHPKRYMVGAIFFVLTVAAVFVAALVGADAIGLPKMDFMQDFVANWRSNEFVTLFILAGCQLAGAIICMFVTPQRTGYARS